MMYNCSHVWVFNKVSVAPLYCESNLADYCNMQCVWTSYIQKGKGQYLTAKAKETYGIIVFFTKNYIKTAFNLLPKQNA